MTRAPTSDIIQEVEHAPLILSLRTTVTGAGLRWLPEIANFRSPLGVACVSRSEAKESWPISQIGQRFQRRQSLVQYMPWSLIVVAIAKKVSQKRLTTCNRRQHSGFLFLWGY